MQKKFSRRLPLGPTGRLRKCSGWQCIKYIFTKTHTPPSYPSLSLCLSLIVSHTLPLLHPPPASSPRSSGCSSIFLSPYQPISCCFPLLQQQSPRSFLLRAIIRRLKMMKSWNNKQQPVFVKVILLFLKMARLLRWRKTNCIAKWLRNLSNLFRRPQIHTHKRTEHEFSN